MVNSCLPIQANMHMRPYKFQHGAKELDTKRQHHTCSPHFPCATLSCQHPHQVPAEAPHIKCRSHVSCAVPHGAAQQLQRQQQHPQCHTQHLHPLARHSSTNLNTQCHKCSHPPDDHAPHSAAAYPLLLLLPLPERSSALALPAATLLKIAAGALIHHATTPVHLIDCPGAPAQAVPHCAAA
jgi:hypothetical protein